MGNTLYSIYQSDNTIITVISEYEVTRASVEKAQNSENLNNLRSHVNETSELCNCEVLCVCVWAR